MADRYWVGGTGTWSSTSTARWSATSGGATGASVPTAADNVFFDANSNVGTGAFTVTMSNSPRVCNNFTASGLDGTMTLAGTSIGLTVSGSLTFQATNFTRTYTGTTTFAATTTGKTITTNGKTLTGGVTFTGSGGGWTLGSALDCGSGTISHLYGTFDTGGYAVTAGSLLSNSSITRTLNLNNSTIILSATSSALVLSGGNLTFNAGTSSINLTNANIFNNSESVTFYDLTIYSATIVSFSGANTFNRLTITANNTNTTFSSSNTINILRSINSSSNISNFIFNANQTINKFELGSSNSDLSANRIMLRSNSIGTQRSIAMTSGSLLDNVDFRDIAITGTTLSGIRLGDCKGNSGITFDAPKTVYYANTVTGNWSDNAWVSTPGGLADSTQFPLAQDTAVFQASPNPTSGATVTISANYNIGTIDMSLRTPVGVITNNMTLAMGSTQPAIYGNWTNGTSTTITGASTLTFAGRQTQTITSAGITFPVNITISNVNTTVRIVGNLTAGNYLTLNDSTLNLNGYTASSAYFEANGSPNLTFNGGTLQFTAGFEASFSGLTTTQGSSAGKIVAGGSSPTFNGGGRIYNCTLEISSSIGINGSNTFTNITNTVTPVSIYFEYNTTNTFTNWNVNGTAGNLVTLDSSDGSASFSLSKASGIVSSDYLNINHSDAIGGAAWYAGTHSIKDGATSGWILTAPPGGNYTISADNGTYAVTGQSATLLRNKVLSGGYGLYTLTGQDAIITFDGEPVVVSEQLLVKLRSFTERRRF